MLGLASLVGTQVGSIGVGLLLFPAYLTLFCFDFLGLSLVDKGKQPHWPPAAVSLLPRAPSLTLPQLGLQLAPARDSSENFNTLSILEGPH